MGQVSSKLRSVTNGGLSHWCPGCKDMHTVWVGEGPGPRWTFNGDYERPTFGPSIKIVGGKWGSPHVCHYYIRSGVIEFCGDSSHALAGRPDVPLPDLPLELRDGPWIVIGGVSVF